MPRLSPRSPQELSLGLRVALFFGGALLVIGVFVFTQVNIRALSHEVSTTSRVLARFLAQASFPATRDPELESIVSDVMGTIDFPIIITDAAGRPRAWRHIEIDPALVAAESIDSLEVGKAIAPVIRERYARVERKVAELDRRNPPVPMTMPGIQQSVGSVHYGDPAVLEHLRWMPTVSAAGVLALLAIGLWGLAILRQSEKRTIWVGMAKETAHQLGTPLSSLMGWVEMLKSHGESGREGESVRLPAADLEETVGEMGRDVDRLSKVAQRFSRIGSEPKLDCVDVTPVVQGVVAYMRRRMPQAPGEVEIRERYASVPAVWLNPDLLEWALENLIANALNALDKRPGLIEVTIAPSKERVGIEIVVTDNGRGMLPAERRRAFEPGFTTKRRGWGLGLALARRVVEDYHRGKIFVGQTAPGRGTSMVVQLPG
jgi:two-component system, NtrC family, sensor histidine kinase KinB